MIRTQDPHHPYVFGARVVIAHPEQDTAHQSLKLWVKEEKTIKLLYLLVQDVVDFASHDQFVKPSETATVNVETAQLRILGNS